MVNDIVNSPKDRYLFPEEFANFNLEEIDYSNRDEVSIKPDIDEPEIKKDRDLFIKNLTSKILRITNYSFACGVKSRWGVSFVNGIYDGLITPLIISGVFADNEESLIKLVLRTYWGGVKVITTALVGGAIIGILVKDSKTKVDDNFPSWKSFYIELGFAICGFGIGYISSVVSSNPLDLCDELADSFIITSALTAIVASAGFELCKSFFQKKTTISLKSQFKNITFLK